MKDTQMHAASAEKERKRVDGQQAKGPFEHRDSFFFSFPLLCFLDVWGVWKKKKKEGHTRHVMEEKRAVGGRCTRNRKCNLCIQVIVFQSLFSSFPLGAQKPVQPVEHAILPFFSVLCKEKAKKKNKKRR